MRFGRTLLPLVLLAVVTARAAAQNGLLTGTIRAEGTPVSGVQVEAFLSGIFRHGGTFSGPDGRWHLALPRGEFTLVFRMPGYLVRRAEVIGVSPGRTDTLDIELPRLPILLERITVTAGLQEQTLYDAPSAVAIQDRRDIATRITATPLDHAAATPGVDIAVQGLQGRQLVARGFNQTLSASLQMMIDFRNAALPAPRANLAYFLPTTDEDLERIEVVRGPSSAIYGPNAADGVVHFVTRSPFDSPGTSVSVSGGSRSLFGASMRHAAIVGNRFAFKLSGSYFRGHEWPAPADSGELFPRDPVIERASGELRADWRLNPAATVTLSMGSALAVRVADYTAIGVYQVRDWRTDFAQLRLTSGRFFAQAYWNGNPGTGRSSSVTTNATTLDHTSIIAAQVRQGFDVGRSNVTLGADAQRTDPQTLGTINGRNESDDRVVEVGGYAQATTRLSSALQVVTAARVDHHSRLGEAVFSPRVGLILSPAPAHTVRLNYNRAFATPASSQLSADILAARLDPLPFSIRAVGVPEDGFRFARSCGGLCLSSPFAPGQLPMDATLLWPAVVAIMQGAGVDLSGIPAPTSADVSTSLRILDPAAGAFRAYSGTVPDLPGLAPTITNALELGYKGTFGNRLAVEASVYTSQRENFIAPLAVFTPNAFLQTASLTAYLSQFMNPAQAAALAAAIGGVDGNPALPGIPLATAGPLGALGGSDLLLTYQNVGDVRLWGIDLSAEFHVTPRLLAGASVSWVDRNLFRGRGLDGADISTNTPRRKASAHVRYRSTARHGFTAEARGRYVGAFRMVDGVLVGDVRSFALADIEAGIELPGPASGVRWSITVQNVTDKRHAEFISHPVIGRLLLTRLQYRF